MHRYVLTCMCALVLTGCHTFQPISLDEVEPGQTVRVRITGAFSDSLQTMIGEDAREFEAVLVEKRDGGVLMEIPVQQILQGMRFETLSQRVELPDAAFVDIETKELDKGRSYIAGGIAAAVLGAIIVTQIGEDSGGAQRPGQGGPQDARVSLPLARLPLAGLSWLWGR